MKQSLKFRLELQSSVAPRISELLPTYQQLRLNIHCNEFSIEFSLKIIHLLFKAKLSISDFNELEVVNLAGGFQMALRTLAKLELELLLQL